MFSRPAAQLALDKYGSHVVEQAFRETGMMRKEKIARELAAGEREVRVRSLPGSPHFPLTHTLARLYCIIVVGVFRCIVSVCCHRCLDSHMRCCCVRCGCSWRVRTTAASSCRRRKCARGFRTVPAGGRVCASWSDVSATRPPSSPALATMAMAKAMAMQCAARRVRSRRRRRRSESERRASAR